MVAGMYAGFEYGMEKARGKQDWVITPSWTRKHWLSLPSIGEIWNGLKFVWQTAVWLLHLRETHNSRNLQSMDWKME